MPMGIVSDSDFEKELGNLNPSSDKNNQSPTVSNPTNQIGQIIDQPPKGRGNGNKEVPNVLRQLIGEESAINGRASALELAKNFGISPSSVSAYDVGATSTSSYDDRPNQSHINEAKQKVSKRARAKLMMALNKMTDDKLEGAKARDLAGIAKDMSAVIKNMDSDSLANNPTTNGPTFVFYSPQTKKEDSFEVVHVKE